jgi:hypothetical protein
VRRNPALSRRVPASSSRIRNSRSLTEGRKEVICTTTRSLQGVMFLSFLRKISGTPKEKNQKLDHRGTKD